MGEDTVARWQAVARESAWKEYAEKTALAGRLLKLAEEVEGSSNWPVDLTMVHFWYSR
jgi:hypothetical protein